MASTHYDVLKVATSATTDTIRAAHAALGARMRQQPQGPQTRAALRALDTAFVVLSDPQLRQQYDEQLRNRASATHDVAANVPRPAAAAPAARAADATAVEPNEVRAQAAAAAFDGQRWAGFWRRYGASFVDSLIYYLPATLALGVAVALLAPRGTAGGALGFMYVLYYLGWIAYQGLLNSAPRVASPGRIAVGAAVVHGQTGQPIGTGRAALRSLLSVITAFLLIPPLLMLVTRRKQTLADLLTDTVVVVYDRARRGVLLVVAGGVFAIFVIGILAAIAIPQYQDYVVRARLAELRVDLLQYGKRIGEYVVDRGGIPASLDALGYIPLAKKATFELQDGGVIVANVSAIGGGAGARVLLVPQQDANTHVITWTCISQGLRASVRPRDCPERETTH